MNTVLLLLPDVAMVALGLLLARHGGWDRRFWDGLEKLVYFVLFPALLFNTILRAPLSIGQAAPVMLGGAATVLLGIAVSWLGRPLLKPDTLQFASGVQCGFRFNSYVALALSQRLGGDEGLALCAMLTGVVVPIVNVAAVYGLARNAGVPWWNALARNPLVLATVGGLAGNALGLHLPEPVSATIARLGTAALACGLLTVGAGLMIEAPAASVQGGPAGRNRTLGMSIWFTATKLLVMPAFAWLLVRSLQLQPLHQAIVVMFGAMPTAGTCYILATRMGGDGAFVARLVTLSMVSALLTVPVWLALIR